ncbi:MAG: hypothetical protein K2Q01_09295, partial [Rickettsiales bacterium]|nr:hypothetical protein [Rickettsiales bacterium]
MGELTNPQKDALNAVFAQYLATTEGRASLAGSAPTAQTMANFTRWVAAQKGMAVLMPAQVSAEIKNLDANTLPDFTISLATPKFTEVKASLTPPAPPAPAPLTPEQATALNTAFTAYLATEPGKQQLRNTNPADNA